MNGIEQFCCESVTLILTSIYVLFSFQILYPRFYEVIKLFLRFNQWKFLLLVVTCCGLSLLLNANYSMR